MNKLRKNMILKSSKWEKGEKSGTKRSMLESNQPHSA